MKRLRYLPAIHTLQKRVEFTTLQQKSTLGEALLTEWLKEIVEQLRHQIVAGNEKIDIADEQELHRYLFEQLEEKVYEFIEQNKLQKVINATGVVIHTNLGRSRLSEASLNHITEVAKSYSTLEYHIPTGNRGSRHTIVEDYLIELTGAEAAMVVNNNAAAVYLVLKAIAEEKEVLVSRGELVEIGGSFRISEIMTLSDATLVEIGTTNKTKLSDYEQAITEDTGMILKVHKSNFAIVGFTEEVETAHLATLAAEHHLPLYEDLGSGTLFDFAAERIGEEPTVQEQVARGIDIISFSGDKLLGGPQAGIIVGKKEYINELKKHQLARVLRVDKFTLASLEATLKAYMAGHALEEIPTLRDITAPAEQIRQKAETFMSTVMERTNKLLCTLTEGVSKVGGGTMPNVDLPTYIVEVNHKQMTSDALASYLRHRKTPIIVRVKDEKVQLDFRTVTNAELVEVIEVFSKI